MDKIQVRALILDYGGVISRPQNRTNINNILKILSRPYHDFEAVYFQERAAYDRGQITGEMYWQNVLKRLGHHANHADIPSLIQEDVKSWTHLNHSMIQFITEIKPKIPKLAIISNMTFDSLAVIKANFDWPDLFDVLVYSCELGINKPEQSIYEHCLHLLNLPPDACLFVDDSLENIQGALKLGLRTIHFRSFPEFLSEFEANCSIGQGR